MGLGAAIVGVAVTRRRRRRRSWEGQSVEAALGVNLVLPHFEREWINTRTVSSRTG